jgi:hypothetical protein
VSGEREEREKEREREREYRQLFFLDFTKHNTTQQKRKKMKDRNRVIGCQ